MNSSQRVFIVGAGQVGATAAFATLIKNLVKEIILIDIAEVLLDAVVMDQQHAAVLDVETNIRKGSYDEIQTDDIVFITAGVAQKEGETRLQLLATNTKILKSILDQIDTKNKQPYIILVTNPVDVLTYIAWKQTGLPKNKIFGTGTFLDSNRLKYFLANKFNASETAVEGLVLGEHGDSSFIAVSTIKINDQPLTSLPDYSPEQIEDYNKIIRDSAYKIISGKGATNYGIGIVIARIVEAIVNNRELTAPLSFILEGEYGLNGLAIGLPCKLDSSGAQLLPELQLTDSEKTQLANSANIIKENIAANAN